MAGKKWLRKGNISLQNGMEAIFKKELCLKSSIQKSDYRNTNDKNSDA